MMKNAFSLPPAVAKILHLLRDAGEEGYLVGGCVRDFLRGIPPHDYDITTSATPARMHEIFSSYRTVDTGIAHGTVCVVLDGTPYEVTTYRVDGGYLDHRHPTGVSFTSDLKEDLSRRDFTVNAVAYCPGAPLVDPFDGEGDIRKKCIRAVGDPDRRFDEDALRILRALRFSATLGFSIESETAAAIHRHAPSLPDLSAERIREELDKLLAGENAPAILTSYADVFAVLFPSWVPRCASLLPLLPQDGALRFAAFFLPLLANGIGEAENAVSSLRFSRRMQERIIKFLTHLDAPHESETEIRRLLAGMGQEDAPLLLLLQKALSPDGCARTSADLAYQKVKALIGKGFCYSPADLAVKGKDLLSLGYRPGKEIGELLDRLFRAVCDGEIPNEKEALLAYLQ